MKGTKIIYANTLGTKYDNNSISVMDKDNKHYRIKVDELLKLIRKVDFNKEKKRVHTYLRVKTNI